MVRKTKPKRKTTEKPKTRNDLMTSKKGRKKISKPSLNDVVKCEQRKTRGQTSVKSTDENTGHNSKTSSSRKPKIRNDLLQQNKNKDEENSKPSVGDVVKQKKGNTQFKTADKDRDCSRNKGEKHEKPGDDSTKPFVCELCPSILKNVKSYKEHQKIHTRKTHKCKECGKFFRYESVLREHYLMHTGETPHQCPHCPKKFRTKSNMKRHLIIHGIHNEKRGLYRCQCDICGKMLRFSSNLLAHKKSHEEERPFMCVECGKQFKMKAHLENHMAYHLKIEPHECETCGKKFRDKSNLRKHKLIHKGDRHFKCDICDWTFLRKDQLKMHQRTHTKLSFQCAVCEKQFKTEAYYKMHLSQHAFGNNYLCDICNKFYSSNSNLKMHMKTCHGTSKSVDVKVKKEKNLHTVKKENGGHNKMEVITVLVLKEKENVASVFKHVPQSPTKQEKTNEPEICNEKSYIQEQDNLTENNTAPCKAEVSIEESVSPKQCTVGNEDSKDEKSKIASDKSASLEQDNRVEMLDKADSSATSLNTELGRSEMIDKADSSATSLNTELGQSERKLEGEPNDTEGVPEISLDEGTNVMEEFKGKPEIESNLHVDVNQFELVQNEEELTATQIEGGVKYIQIYTDGRLHTLTGVKSSAMQNS